MILNKEWITDFFRLREPLRNMIRKLASSCVLPYPPIEGIFYNGQYVPIDIRTYRDSHDRFQVVDEMDVYHIGASLKDLGKKNVRLLKTEYSCNSDY